MFGQKGPVSIAYANGCVGCSEAGFVCNAANLSFKFNRFTKPLCTILEMARALPRPQIGSESPNEFPIRELAGVQCSRYDSPRRRPHCPTFPFSIVASDAARLVQATRHRRRRRTMPLVPALPLRDAVPRAEPETAHASAP